jgi:hypothetical protein
MTNVGIDWVRLRWGLATAFPLITPTEVVQRILTVFDEGTTFGGGPLAGRLVCLCPSKLHFDIECALTYTAPSG